MEDITNDSQDTSAGEGVNTENTTGTGNQTVAKTDDTQAKIDAAVKARLAEEKRRSDAARVKAIDEALNTAKTEWEKERDEHVKTAVELALKERDLRDVRKTIQTEYGLTDAQLERISGDDETSLRADAELLFASLKQKKAPIITPGGNEQQKDTSPNQELNDWLRTTTPKQKKY
jgi:hypothetical protein